MRRLDEVLGSLRSAKLEARSSKLDESPSNLEPRTSRSEAESEAAEAVCPHCGGAGFVRREVALDHADFGRAFPCQCVLQEREGQRLARLLRYSKLGEGLTRRTFDNLISRGRSSNRRDQERFKVCVEDARAFAESPEGWLVLTGPSGCGKTHIAAAIVNRAVECGRPALFMLVPDLLDHLRAAYRPDSDIAYDELFEQVRNAPLLALDGLGTQSATPWAQEKLFQLINHRFNSRLPTVVTTSVPLEQLDERLRTRLSEMSLARVYELQLEGGRTSHLAELDMMDRPMIQKMTFESFDASGHGLPLEEGESLEAAFRLALSYAENPEGSIMFSGREPGCGKTHLAAAIANYRRQMGDSPCFVLVADLLDYLRRSMDEDSSISHYEALERVRTAPLLILDDLDVRVRSPWVREKLFQLINYRYTSVLPTVFTTNLNQATLTMRDQNASDDVAQRLATRLWDPTFCTEVDIRARSYRVSLPRPRRGGSQEEERPTRAGRVRTGAGGPPSGGVPRRGAAGAPSSREGPSG